MRQWISGTSRLHQTLLKFGSVVCLDGGDGGLQVRRVNNFVTGTFRCLILLTHIKMLSNKG